MDAREETYFPRSILEAWQEVDELAQDLAVDPYILLYYPQPYYFMVSKNNPELAKAIEQGMEKSIDDGRFDQLFFHTFTSKIRRAKTNNRTLLETQNPFIKGDKNIDNPRYWIKPNDFEEHHQAYIKKKAQ